MSGVAAAVDVDVIVPTIGRDSLRALLQALAAGAPLPGRVVLVDDRRDAGTPLAVPAGSPFPVEVLRSGGRGPAAARNVGWRAGRAPWVAFLDDDVVPDPEWAARLVADLRDLPADVGGSQGRLRVPVPVDRPLTDWERNVRALETSWWITADMAYRRPALAAVGGFDERFPRAYREDADLALRVLDAGWRLVRGERSAAHPVQPASAWVSVRLQAGNAADAWMRHLHGRRWRARAHVPRGRFRRHAAIVGAGTAAVAAAAAGRPRAALAAGALWAVGTGELAWARVAPGPRDRAEVARMVATSVALPWAALRWRLQGELAAAWRRPRRWARASAGLGAVLFDRDGTLVVDVPYNGDPARVEPVPGARHAIDQLRAAGVRVGVISNQSGVARGLLTMEQVARVNARVDELLGPFDTWVVCPHGPDDGCGCRKPSPGMVHQAAAALGVAPERCVVIGDIGADVEAARAARARGILVPTPVTRPEEIARAPEVAPDLVAAVARVLGAA